MEEKQIFYVDHYQPNQYHPETGFFLLWVYTEDQVWDLVDWALYSPKPEQGMFKAAAEAKVITTGQKLGGKVELRKTL